MSLTEIPVGSTVFGRKGTPYLVLGIDGDRVLLEFPDGTCKQVVRSVIRRWEPPKKPLEPKPIEVGDTVRLKGTNRTDRVIRLYQVYRGLEDGVATYESWAELQTVKGTQAFWRIEQLEVVI